MAACSSFRGSEIWASESPHESIVSPAYCIPSDGGSDTAIGTCGTQVFIPPPTGGCKETGKCAVLARVEAASRTPNGSRY